MSLVREPLCRCRRLVRGRRTRSSRCRLIWPPIECSLLSLHRCFSVSPGHAIDVLTACCYWAMSPAATMAGLGWCSPLRPYSPSPLTHTFAALRNPTFSLTRAHTHTHTHTTYKAHLAPTLTCTGQPYGKSAGLQPRFPVPALLDFRTLA